MGVINSAFVFFLCCFRRVTRLRVGVNLYVQTAVVLHTYIINT